VERLSKHAEMRTTERLRNIVFRLDLGSEKDESGRAGHYYGTGFFIHANGFALTAYHNLPKYAREDPTRPILARFQGRGINLYWLLSEPENETWQHRHDIALLQGPAGEVDPAALVDLAYLPISMTRPQRARYWGGMPIVLCGFPLRNVPVQLEMEKAFSQ